MEIFVSVAKSLAVKMVEYPMRFDLQLFAEDGPGGEKTEEPTPKKLKDARKKGQVAKSEDLTSAVILLAFFLILWVYVGPLGNALLANFNGFYEHISDLTNDEFTVTVTGYYVRQAILRVVTLILPFAATFVVAAIVSEIFQVHWKISFEPMKPKLEKISPVKGFKNMFSRDKLVKLGMSLAKIAIMGVVVFYYLRGRWYIVLQMYDYTLGQSIETVGDIIVGVGLRIALCFCAIAFADYGYHRWKFNHDMKMTKQEVKDEFKQTEGDPHVKSQQRSVMRRASQQRMMQQVPQADVVITNPTHLAVALRYDREQFDAPIVLAKGADYLAEKIKDIATESDVPIVENKPLARMLYYNVELGDQIPPELYQMVAEVLAYVYGLKGKV